MRHIIIKNNCAAMGSTNNLRVAVKFGINFAGGVERIMMNFHPLPRMLTHYTS